MADLSSLFDNARPAAQQPNWPDREHLQRVVEQLRKMPPLVFAGEADALK